MEKIYSGVGVLCITAKSLFWISEIQYLGFAMLGLATVLIGNREEKSLPEEVDCATYFQPYIVWMAATNALAFLFFALFHCNRKGTTPSVIGSFGYLANIINMFVLFVTI